MSLFHRILYKSPFGHLFEKRREDEIRPYYHPLWNDSLGERFKDIYHVFSGFVGNYNAPPQYGLFDGLIAPLIIREIDNVFQSMLHAQNKGIHALGVVGRILFSPATFSSFVARTLFSLILATPITLVAGGIFQLIANRKRSIWLQKFNELEIVEKGASSSTTIKKILENGDLPHQRFFMATTYPTQDNPILGIKSYAKEYTIDLKNAVNRSKFKAGLRGNFFQIQEALVCGPEENGRTYNPFTKVRLGT